MPLALMRFVLLLVLAGFVAGVAAPAANAQRPTGPSDCRELVSSPNGIEPRGVRAASANPLAGLDLFVDDREPPTQWRNAALRRGDDKQANLLTKLADAPKFKWFGAFSPMSHVTHYLRHAQCTQPGSVPSMVVFRHQGTECNSTYQGGGVAEDNRTKAWYREFARTVGDARVIIAFEPDSIGTIDCLAKGRRAARVELLRYGVDVLSKLPNATIYLEATASDWKPAKFTIRTLRKIGIAKVRGFMLNVTHEDWTLANVRYGREVSRGVGGKPFVVNTSFNGRGPVHYNQRGPSNKRINVYCNPSFRGLGPTPTTNTGLGKVDGYLYINRPWQSGMGPCNGAPPKRGADWLFRALSYSRYATEWLRPPKGTVHGLRKRYSLCRLGAPVRDPNDYSNVAPAERCRR